MKSQGRLSPSSQAPLQSPLWLYECQRLIRACHSQSNSAPAAIQNMLTALGAALSASRCLFFSLDRNQQAGTFQTEYRESPNLSTLPNPLPEDAALTLIQAAQQYESPYIFMSLADTILQEQPALSLLFHQWQAQSGMICPVGATAQPIGILMLQRAAPCAWQPEEQALALFAADHIEMALLKAHSGQSTTSLQAQLAENQERLELLLQGSNDAFWEWNIKTDQRYWNNRYYEILGLDPKVHQPSKALLWQLLHPDDIPLVEKSVQQALETNAHYEIRIRMKHASDEYRHVLSRARCSRDEQGKPHLLVGAFTDITPWVQAEQTLQESEARFRAMADSSPVIIYVSDQQGTAYVNKYCLEFFGAELEKLHGQAWQHFIHPEDINAFYQHCWEAGQRLAVFNTEVRARNYANEYRWLMVTGAPRILPSGELTGYVGVAVDITELKKAQEDLKNYAYQLEQSNRELEQFATIASHDLQEPLRKVMLFSHFLKATQQGQLNDEAHDYLNRIQHATERMRALITDLLDLSRIHRNGQPFRKIDLAEVMDCVLSDLQYTIGDSGGEVKIGPLLSLDGDFKQIQQLLQNLLDNALKFHRKDAKPVVQISAQSINNQCCEIEISDNGIGFEEKYKDRIFGVFERLHSLREYEGTGIGLALCKKIVERHQGTITVKSQPGQGTTFIVRLPLQQKKPDLVRR